MIEQRKDGERGQKLERKETHFLGGGRAEENEARGERAGGKGKGPEGAGEGEEGEMIEEVLVPGSEEGEVM